MPAGQGIVTLEIVVYLRVLVTALEAVFAAIQDWQNFAMQKIIQVHRLARFVPEDRAVLRIAAAEPIHLQTLRQGPYKGHSAPAAPCLGLCDVTFPDGLYNANKAVLAVLPE